VICGLEAAEDAERKFRELEQQWEAEHQAEWARREAERANMTDEERAAAVAADLKELFPDDEPEAEETDDGNSTV
jgi:hypothetical protein